MIKVLYFGDIVGRAGRQAIGTFISNKKDQISPDLVIANADNVSAGKGPTIKAYEELEEMGVDVMTGGDHIWDYKEAVDILTKKNSKLIRPYNYPEVCPGKGSIEVSVRGANVVISSMLGRTWTKEGLESPFYKTDELLEKIKTKVVIMDFHAEATSEKYAYGWDFAGKISAVVGSHTHVQTADAQILKNYTGYITDAGFCGPKESVIGVVPEESIKMFRTGIKSTLGIAKGDIQINALLLEIDEKTGATTSISTINEVISI